MIYNAAIFLVVFTQIVQVFASPDESKIDGVTYQVLRVPANAVCIVWKDQNGKPLRTFPAVARYLTTQGESPETLMNGGIFEPDGSPSGLLIQSGKKLKSVNRRNGKGNFFLKPNGIFLINLDGAAIIRTDEYPLKNVQVMQAVQSGPLLLRNGKVHLRFNAGSTSRLHRNGVGVSKDGKVVFAMTNFNSPKFPNLYEFAQLFKLLGCDDALFLDGDLSQMRTGVDILKPSNSFGSIIAIIKKRRREAGE